MLFLEQTEFLQLLGDQYIKNPVYKCILCTSLIKTSSRYAKLVDYVVVPYVETGMFDFFAVHPLLSTPLTLDA